MSLFVLCVIIRLSLCWCMLRVDLCLRCVVCYVKHGVRCSGLGVRSLCNVVYVVLCVSLCL